MAITVICCQRRLHHEEAAHHEGDHFDDTHTHTDVRADVLKRVPRSWRAGLLAAPGATVAAAILIPGTAAAQVDPAPIPTDPDVTTTTAAPAPGAPLSPESVTRPWFVTGDFSLHHHWIKRETTTTANGASKLTVGFDNEGWRDVGAIKKAYTFKGPSAAVADKAWKSGSLSDFVTCSDLAINPIIGFPSGVSVTPSITQKTASVQVPLPANQSGYAVNWEWTLTCQSTINAKATFDRGTTGTADFGKSNGGGVGPTAIVRGASW